MILAEISVFYGNKYFFIDRLTKSLIQIFFSIKFGIKKIHLTGKFLQKFRASINQKLNYIFELYLQISKKS